MFYSHEILTSREHGVATIWLVATLGARSTMKKVNRKAILNVDVPRACNSIINPASPMALRLQSSLLYGVSRVYREQCVYTLTDVQVLLDKMKTTLKVIHGMGLDPDAGKARPDQLILPYDPSFVPELSLPGLSVDFANLGHVTEWTDLTLNSSLLSTTPSNASQTRPQDLIVPQLDISSSSISLGEMEGLHMMSGALVESAQRAIEFGNEAGILLQPDFEFDEDGNIVDLFGSARRGSVLRGQSLSPSGHLVAHSIPPESHLQLTGLADDPMNVDDDDVILVGDDTEITPDQSSTPKQNLLPDPDHVNREETTCRTERGKLPLKKSVKAFLCDEETKFSNATLIKWNNDYLSSMQSIKKQRAFRRKLSQAKKNGPSWVFAIGIGSVGLGVGASRSSHPLKEFSGESLLLALPGGSRILPSKKRPLEYDSGDDNDWHKRARKGLNGKDASIDLSRGLTKADIDELTKDDVEFGRHAPSSLQDDMSSQMPWNITASLQGSRLGSASSIPRPFDNAEFSSHRQLSALGRVGGRLPSASPLAGRSRLADHASHERLSSLSIAGAEFFDGDPIMDIDLEDSSLHMQGHGGMFRDRQSTTGDANVVKHCSTKIQNVLASLSDEDRNFFFFVESHITAIQPITALMFSDLLPPDTTTKAVATQGVIHLLTLATNGVVKIDQSSELLYHLDEDKEMVEFDEIFISLES